MMKSLKIKDCSEEHPYIIEKTSNIRLTQKVFPSWVQVKIHVRQEKFTQ